MRQGRLEMHLVRPHCDLSLNEVAERFGVSSYGVIGLTCHEVRMRMRAEKAFRKEVERIDGIISQQKI